MIVIRYPYAFFDAKRPIDDISLDNQHDRARSHPLATLCQKCVLAPLHNQITWHSPASSTTHRAKLAPALASKLFIDRSCCAATFEAFKK